MSPAAWLGFPLALLGTVVVALVVLNLEAVQASGLHFADASSAVTFTTGAALVIERLIEAGWTLSSTTRLGSYWPMSGIAAYAGQLVSNLDAAFAPFVVEAEAAVQAAGGASAEVQQAATALKQDITRFGQEIADLRKVGQPGNQQNLLLSAATAQRIQYLKAKYASQLGAVSRAATLASSAVNSLQDFVATFKDNPGRRIISICVGGVIGIIVTTYLRLDLFQALATPGTAPTAGGDAAMHIVLTGLVIGLGASPTHEVIRLVQEAKEQRRGTNALQPDQA